jgi:hypothetical protein
MSFYVSKKQYMKLFTIILTVTLFSVATLSAPVSALISQNSTSWFWVDSTNVSAIATGDVNGDGKAEIVTAGWFLDGTRNNAQLAVWNSSTLALINVVTWFWTSETQISSVAIGDVNGDGNMEIVTGGSYFDGTFFNSQLAVWNGNTLGLINVVTWHWTSDTQISSVAVANITGTTGLSIITGGSYFDGTRRNAQLTVWNGVTLALQNVKTWFWNADTYINSVAVGSIAGGSSLSIVTGGSFNDGTRLNSQLVVWNAANLALNNVLTWYWTGDTEINSVAVANVTGGTALNIVTGGYFFDGTRNNAQLVEWNGATLGLQNVATWFQTSNTKVNSVSIANYTGGTSLDIFTGGVFNDLSKNNAQLIDWNGASLTVISSTSWFQTSGTQVNSVVVANTGSGNRVIAGGSYFDLVRDNAQLSLWG